MEDKTPQPAQSGQRQVPTFGIEKVYIKDFSLEAPNAPQIFLEHGAPDVSIQVNNSGTPLGEGAFDATLTVTVTAKLGDKTLFLVEVSQAGIFRIANVPENEIEPLLAVACPNILQAYAREVISDATVRAGFAPVLLQPINFEALYLQNLQERKAAAASRPADASLQ
ncbi:MAG: protein-export chaperone SecB [Zoogloeaceae bacterium]|jgi:preprotein translocase subunit SecB|nr:protein-export chaperone SecB [Zoogloeaceae bacterium]